MSYTAAEAARRGYFKEAARLLIDERPLSNRILRLEIQYYLGDADYVRAKGPRIFSESKDDPRFAFRAASVLASQYFDEGSTAQSLDYCQRAVQFAELPDQLNVAMVPASDAIQK